MRPRILPGGIWADRFHRIKHQAFRNVWDMAHYRQWQPPARFAPIAERDDYPTGRASAELPGGTGEFGGEPRGRTAHCQGRLVYSQVGLPHPSLSEKDAPGIQPDGLPIPRQEGQSWSSLVCWYCLRCQANRFYGPARSRRQCRPFNPMDGEFGGPEQDRTDDIQLAKLALSQLSYRPKYRVKLRFTHQLPYI